MFRTRSLPAGRAAALAGLAALAILAPALSCAPSIPTYQFQYAEKRATLKNGLRLVVIPDATTPMVEVDVRYEVGSNEDPPGKAGLAHLVEHMMFQHHLFGADKPATFELLPQIAVSYNAYTTWDKTHYYLISRKEDVEQLLRLEAARMAKGCESIPAEQFEREREVVRNEIRQRTGSPEGQVFQLLLDAAYPRQHAYNQMIGGNDAQLSNITFQDVCDFMARYYTPDRATVVVTGNVDVNAVGKQVKFAFGGIAPREPAPRKQIATLPGFKYQKIVHKVDVERPQVHVIWKLPPRTSDDWPAAQAMIGIMAGEVSYFVDEWEVAASVNVALLGGDHAPIYVLSMELYDKGDVDEALGYVWKATKNLHRPFTMGDIDDDAKARARAGFVMGLESLAARAGTVADLVQYHPEFAFGSDKEYLLEELRKIDQLDADRFADFIKGTLRKDNAVVVVIDADKKGIRGDKRSGLKFSTKTHDKEAEPILDPAEARTPLPAPATASILAGAERYTLGNGMDVVLLPKTEGIPVVTAQLVFDVGSAHEPPNLAGLADVTASRLRPPPDANAFRATGVSVGGFADTDHTAFFARGVEIYLDVIIKGLERLVRAGTYSQKALESWQKATRDEMKTQRYRRREAFSSAMRRAIYGDDHPYATTGDPTEASVGRLNYDAVTSFQRTHYSGNNATLIVVGRFDPAKAKAVIADSFGDWSGGHEDAPVPPQHRARTGPEYFGVVGREDSPQMDISIAFPAPAGVDGQHAARLVLAGMLNLRMARIRSTLGSTYGVYARRASNVGPSAYVMGGQVDAARAGESLRAMRDAVDSLRRGEDFDIDFVRARRAVLKQLLDESTETFALASRLANIAAYDLPPDHFDQLIRYVATVSTAQIRALIASELGPQGEIVGCMADRDTLLAAFAEAGIDSYRLIEPVQ